MNKIFKVVWSKSKQCYVVVSEMAKNNSGKKRVLATVLAALVATGGMSLGHVDAANNTSGGGQSSADASIAIGSGWANSAHANTNFSIAIGDQSNATGEAAIALGRQAKTKGEQAAVAIGNQTEANAAHSTAVGSGTHTEAKYAAAFGFQSKATKEYATAIGSGAQGEGEDSQAIGRQAKTTGYRAVAVGTLANALKNSAIAVGEYTVADGTNSIAMGKSSKAHSFDAIAIGHNNNSRTYSAISIGTDNTSDVAYGLTDAQFDALPYDENNINDSNKTDPRRGVSSTIAIGRNNVAGNVEAIAIGTETKATKTDAIGIGARVEATGDYAVGIGGASRGKKISVDEYGTAVGALTNAAQRATALGAGANAVSQKSVAVGYRATTNAQKATSNYEFSGSHGTLSPAGYNTETITVNSASAPAGGAVAGNYYDAGSGIAIGNGATVSDESDRAVVVGPDAKTNGNAHYSVVLGSGSHADASDGFVAGHGSYVKSRESIAIGSGANVSGNENIRSQAIGYGATVTGTGAYDATAIGATAQVTGVQGGVALGAGSMLDRTTASNENVGWNSKFLDGTVVRNRSYKATVDALGTQWDAGAQIGAVSVGNDDQKRQIINVAAGNKDTDAVNVAQLKNVGVRVGADTNTATIGTNKVAADFLAYNGQLNIKGDGNRVTTVSENDANGKDANVNVKFDYSGLVKGKGNITVEEKTDSLGKTVYEVSSTGGSSSSWNLKSTGNTTSDSNTTAKTIEDTNTVNMVAGKNLTVKQTNNTDGADVEFALKNDLDLTKDGSLTIGDTKLVNGGLTITGGPSITKTGINAGSKTITNVSEGINNNDAVNVSQLKAVAAKERHIKPGTYAVDGNGKVTMTYVNGDNQDVTGEAVITGIAKQDLSNINNAGKNVITGLGTIVKAGDNVNVSESSDATTGQKTYTVNAVTPVVYTKADGTKVVKRPDGTFTTNLDGAPGNNVDKADVIASFVDGNGNVTGGNMVINNVGSAIDKTGTSTGDTFLTKLDTAATNTPNAAVNVKDLKTTSDALVDKGLKFTGNNTGTENAHKLGSLVKVQGEGLAATDVPTFASAAGNIAVVANGTDTLELKLNKNLKGINSVNNGSTAIVLNDAPNATTPAVTIKGGNLSLGDGTTNNKIVNVAPGTNDTDAVNYSQIKGLRTEVKPGSNVTVNKTHGTDGHDIYTISATATGGTASSWNIKSSADTANGGATATGHDANAVTVSDQKTVEMVAGKNLTVKQAATTDGAKVEFALSDEIGVGEKGQPGVPGKDGIDGKIGVNGKDGSAVVINGKDGSIGLNGKDGANGLSIKGDKGADGVDGKNGTNGMTRIVYEDNSNTKHEVATLDDGLKFAGDDAQGTDKSKVITKKLNNTVDIIGGANSTNLTDNNIGVNNDNGKLKVQLAKTIDLTKDGSVTTGNTKVDNGGVTITAPAGGTTTNVSLTQSGLDNGGNKIVNVKAGDVSATSTDAVNGSQLHEVKVAERHIKPGTYAVDGNGKVTMKYVDGDNHDVAGEAVITGIAKQDLSNINNAGKNVITGLGTIVKAGDNVNVSESSDATTGQKTYTVNAVTPVVYTKADGTKVVKRPDGTFTTNLDGAPGNNVDKADVIASFVDGNGNVTGGNMVINNVGSAIDKTGTSTGDTFLTKLDTAATNTPNAAVNVKDLKTTSDALVDKGLKFTGNNTGTENAHKLGSLVKVQGEGLAATDVPTFASAAGNIAVVANGTDTLELKLNKNLKGINSVNNGSTAIVLNDAPNATTPAVTIKGGNLSLGDGTTNNKIVNVAPGTNDTDAVNYSQIKGLRTEVKPGSNVTVNKTHGTDGHDIYTISATATGGTASSWNIKSSADTANGGATATGHDANAVTVSDQKTVEMVAGKNLTVKQAATTDGAKVEFALSDEIGVGEKGQPGVPGKDGIDGKIGVNGKDGSAVVINGKDGSIGLNGKDGANGLSIKGDKGADGVDGKNGTNGMTRIVYEDNSNTKHEVATLDDGLKFAGDDAQGTDKSKVITKKLNNTVDIIGGANSTNLTDNNIGVNNDNGKLKVQLAKTIDLTKDGSVTTGNTKVDNGGVTITAPTGGTTTNVSLTQSGLDNGGNKIVNVKEGTADTDAVNVKQLKDAKTVLVDGKNTKKEGTGTAADPYKVNVEGALVDISSITNGNGSGKLSFGPNQTVTVDGDHSITLNAKTGKIGGLQNKTFDPNNFTSGQAATEDQLKSVHNTLKASELHIAPTTGTTEAKGGTASGSTNVYKYDATNKTVTLTYNNGNGQAVSGPKAVIDFSALNVTPGNNYGFNTNAGGNLATGTTVSVKPVASGKTVTYAAGKNLTVAQTETNGDLTYTYALDKDLTNLDKVVVNGKDGVNGHDGVTIIGPQGAAGATGIPGTNGIDGKVGISGKDGKDAVSISGKDGVGHIGLTGPAGKDGKDATADITVKDGVPGVDGAPGDSMTRIVYKDKDGKDHEVATHDDGMKFAGDNGQTNQDTNPNVIKKHLNNVVDIIGGATGTLTDNNIGVNADNGKLKVQLAKDINLTKDGSLTIGGTKVDGNGLTITGGPSVTKTGIDAGNKAITNVANGTNDSDAVNVSQLKGSITTVKSSDGSITVTDANAGSTDPTKGHAYDIKVNNQGVVNNAQLPVEYTTADGTKVYKQPNGSFNTAKDGSGTVVNAGDVIASMNNGSDSTTAPMKLANVGSSIAGQNGSTYLDKINAAASNRNTENNAVNVSDLKNTAQAIGDKGLNFGAQSGTDIHKNLGEKLEIVGGGQKADSEYDASNIKTMTKDGKVVVALDKNIKADTVTVGKDGKDGVDGKIGVNGKDGASVTINGKDGSIGLQGPKGADGKDGASATIKVKDGVPGVDGKDGETLTRIVYETKDGVEHQVATHDDGLKFTGNNTSTVNKHHLNSLVKVQGEGVTEAQSTSFQSAAGNINVKANGTDTLEVQLNKDLKGINSIRNSATGPAMTFNTGDIAISGGNLNMGDNKITNVGPGTDGTDAVNLNQLKAARTVVTSKDGSVTITPNENQATHEMTYDLKVNGAHDPRVDQLNEEIGRVGAQGAALAALKPIQYDPLEPTQIMAGYGNYRGNSALAVGVAHYKNESTMLHAGMSWAGGSSHMMANAGVTWKFGNRDAENAIADRYRKGPISAAYALQNEMAAVKAQNAGLKSEVSDLKAENQQMKAQIAAMMAKLGL